MRGGDDRAAHTGSAAREPQHPHRDRQARDDSEHGPHRGTEHRDARTRTLVVTVPDLGDDKKNRALEQLIVDFAARLARYAESVG